MTHGRYHPVMQCKVVGGFDANNNLTALHMRLSGQSILADVFPARLDTGKDPLTFQGLMPAGTEHAFGYSIPNLMIDHAMRNPHIKPGFWRGVNINQNAIFLECFMDELAQSAGEDELEFRRKLMRQHLRNLAVLNAVAERIGWGKPAPQGVYRGLAHMKAFNAYVAAAAEVSVTGGNKIKVHPARREEGAYKRREAARVHHAPRRRGGVAARGARAANRTGAPDRCPDVLCRERRRRAVFGCGVSGGASEARVDGGPQQRDRHSLGGG
jgi:hypothetical protein